MKSKHIEGIISALVIGDIHHDTDDADRLIDEHRSRASHVVILGDIFDRFCDGPALMQRSCEWLADNLRDEKWTFIAGNHDVSYASGGGRNHYCPGWTPEKQRIFERICGDVAREKMRLAVNVGPWLLSHAGVTAGLIKGRSVAELVSAADKAWTDVIKGRANPLLGRGRARGGPDPVGGITWCDWRGEFRPTAGLHQVVGHTRCFGVVRGKHLIRDGSMRVTETYCENPLLQYGELPALDGTWSSVNFCIDCEQAFGALVTPSSFELLPARRWIERRGSQGW